MSDFKVEVLGRKAPRRRKRKPKTGKRTAALHPRRLAGALVIGILRWLLRPRFVAWTAAAMMAGAVIYGTPHLLVTHNCTGVGTPSVRCTQCRYVGVQGFHRLQSPNRDCPVVALFPVKWIKLKNTIVNH